MAAKREERKAVRHSGAAYSSTTAAVAAAYTGTPQGPACVRELPRLIFVNLEIAATPKKAQTEEHLTKQDVYPLTSSVSRCRTKDKLS